MRDNKDFKLRLKSKERSLNPNYSLRRSKGDNYFQEVGYLFERRKKVCLKEQ